MNIIEKKKNKSTLSLSLEGELTIYHVTKLKDAMTSYLEKKTNIDIDLSSIYKIDTAGFQLLSTICKEVKSAGKSFAIINPSADVMRIFALYGESI